MEKKIIHVKRLVHKSQNRIVLEFKYDAVLIGLVKQLDDARWSSGLKLWHVRDTADNLTKLKELFKDMVNLEMEISADQFPLKTEEKKAAELSEEASQKLEQFKFWMRSRRYSESTIGTYTDALRTFLKYYNNKQVAEITNQDVIDFNNNYILKKELSASFQNQVVNAFKLFYKNIENKKIDIESVHRPKRAFVLPNVLSKEEVKLLLNSLSNVKHKTMLSLIYSCGLRRSELLNLKLSDIDSKRNLVIIRQSKGRKDRIAPLSLKMLELLRSYFIAYKPKYWLFEGQDRNSKYDERSLASVLKQAVEKSKINKRVTLHWLRHSYATHLLESGTDLRYIQEILGHSRSTTTEIYTHVSNKSIQKIVSPFDNL